VSKTKERFFQRVCLPHLKLSRARGEPLGHTGETAAYLTRQFSLGTIPHIACSHSVVFDTVATPLHQPSTDGFGMAFTQVTASMLNVEHLAAQLSELVGTATFTSAAPSDGLVAAAAAASSVTGTSTTSASYAAEATVRNTLEDVSRLADDLASLMPKAAAAVQGAAVAAASEVFPTVPETQEAEAEAECDDRVSELASESDLGSSAAGSSATAGGRGGSALSAFHCGSGSGHSHRGPSSVTRHSPSGSGATTASASSTSPASVASAATVSTSSSASYHLQPQKRTTHTSDHARFLMPPPPPVPSSAKATSSSDTGAAAEALRLQGSDEATNNGNNAERALLTAFADGSGMGRMLWEESSIGSEAPPDAAAVDDDDSVKVEVEVGPGSEAPPVSFIERYMQKRKAGATEVEAYHQASEEEAAAMKAAGGAADGGES
jgi:hypothetical protein